MSNHQFNIFFSWQSDIEGNKAIIRKGIKDACKKLTQSNGYEINIDEATRDIPGSPTIEKAVMDKIAACDVFIADITPITQHYNKQIPNPNVLIELGYALKCIELARIIIVAKKGDYKDNELPFDINHNRLGKFDGNQCDLDFEIEESIKYVLDNGKFQYVRFFNDLHLKQNISIGKYLPDVFMEDREYKELLRCFVTPYTFYTKKYHEAEKLNFNYYNQVCELKERGTFDFSVTTFPESIYGLNFTDATKCVDNIIGYLNCKVSELEQCRSNSSYYAKRKIENVIKGLEFCNKKICLIKGKAGQGKTNLVCDLVENVLLTRNIPFVYLNGNEIDANNVGDTMVKSLYPEENYSLGDMLRYVQRFCAQQHKPLIIIIDGLNEHGNSALLKVSLQNLINTLLDYDFVRIIITCRTEYYYTNYNDLFSTCQNEVIEHESYSHLDEQDCNTLISNYCDYFKINASFTREIRRDFGENLLLLRIFCEAYKNQDVGPITHIRKDNLFLTYYQAMRRNLAVSLQNNGTQVKESDISFFVNVLVELMLEKETFSNIPINDILSKLSPEQKNIFYQFLDSNILIKRELGDGLFNNEVVGFTFDEFRDFMISHYLIDKVFNANYPDIFENKVLQYTSSNHILREGLTCFLYCYSKEHNPNVLQVLKEQDWYKSTFIRYIWEINEEYIDDTDIILLKELITAFPRLAERLIFQGRLNTNRYKKININLLVDILIGFTDDDLEQFLDLVWPNNDGDEIFRTRESTRDHFISSIEKCLHKTNSKQIDCWPNILIPILFLSPFSWNAERLFLEIYKQDKILIQNRLIKIKTTTNSNKLKTFIETL